MRFRRAFSHSVDFGNQINVSISLALTRNYNTSSVVELAETLFIGVDLLRISRGPNQAKPSVQRLSSYIATTCWPPDPNHRQAPGLDPEDLLCIKPLHSVRYTPTIIIFLCPLVLHSHGLIN